MNQPFHYRRFNKTISFLKKHVSPPSSILDLGVENRISEFMKHEGFQVTNTLGENLDIEFKHLNDKGAEVVTAFEIFEHMLAPYNLLKELNAPKLIATVPLKVWFNSAYWNELDDLDKHYHEFEPKQFDLLLKKTNWRIIDKEIWTTPPGKINGIRPLLRFIWPSYYAVYCEKIL